jgi:hypothetical protein
LFQEKDIAALKTKGGKSEELLRKFDSNLTFLSDFYPGSKVSPVELVSFLASESIEQKLLSDGIVSGGTFDECRFEDYSAAVTGNGKQTE